MCVNVLQKRDLWRQSRTHMVKEENQTRRGWGGGRRRTEVLVPSWLGTIGPQVPQQEAGFSCIRGVMTPCGARSRSYRPRSCVHLPSQSHCAHHHLWYVARYLLSIAVPPMSSSAVSETAWIRDSASLQSNDLDSPSVMSAISSNAFRAPACRKKALTLTPFSLSFWHSHR